MHVPQSKLDLEKEGIFTCISIYRTFKRGVYFFRSPPLHKYLFLASGILRIPESIVLNGVLCGFYRLVLLSLLMYGI